MFSEDKAVQKKGESSPATVKVKKSTDPSAVKAKPAFVPTADTDETDVPSPSPVAHRLKW